jgi:hypothetical protein
MTVLSDILTTVREDIILRIYDIAPILMEGAQWSIHEESEDVEEEKGRSRLFMLELSGQDAVTFGTTEIDYDLRYEIRIGYETGPLWMDAAFADDEKIRRALLYPDNKPAGVNYYMPGDESPLEKGEGFNWLTIPLTARVSATAS